MAMLPLAVKAQWSTNTGSMSVYLTNTSYNVGIGINPQTKLHINGAIRGNASGGALRISTLTGYVDIGPQDANWAHMSTDLSAFLFNKSVFVSNGQVSSSAATDLKLQIGGATKLTVSNTTSNVGIGVDAPLAKLHVVGDLLLDAGSPTIYTATTGTDQNRYLQISNSSLLNVPAGVKAGGLLIADAYNYASPAKNNLVVKGKVGIGNNLTSNPNGYTLLVSGKVSAPEFYINDQIVVSSQWVTAGANVHFNGGVGIGTTLTDNPRGYKLAVNGKIGAKDVRVENASTTWPDYVFEPTYELPTLEEVESFIKENNHLQDVPSAEIIKKEGHELGNMDAILLRKIEELTLYMIELKKENEQLKKRLEKVEQK